MFLRPSAFCFEVCDYCLRSALFVRVFFLGLVAECWQQFVPDDVEFRLHVSRVGSDCDDCVLFGEHKTELSVLAVTAIGSVAAATELEAVALVPVATRVASVGNLFGRGLINSFCGQNLCAVPHAALQVELPELRDVFRSKEQAVAADRNSLRAGLPFWIFDPQRFKQPGRQILKHRLPRYFLHDRGKHVSRRRVVAKVRSWFVRNGMGQKTFHPVRRFPPVQFILMACVISAARLSVVVVHLARASPATQTEMLNVEAC